MYYYGIGYNDYLYAKNSISISQEIGTYNGLAFMASQSAKKFLKAIIEAYFIEDEVSIKLMKSQNLRSLFEKIKTKFPDCPLDSKDYKWLGDFYYDARYPGDNFIVVSEDSGIECIRLLEELLAWIHSLDEVKYEKLRFRKYY